MCCNSFWKWSPLLFALDTTFISKCHGIVVELTKIQATYHRLELQHAFNIQMIKSLIPNSKLILILWKLSKYHHSNSICLLTIDEVEVAISKAFGNMVSIQCLYKVPIYVKLNLITMWYKFAHQKKLFLHLCHIYNFF